MIEIKAGHIKIHGAYAAIILYLDNRGVGSDEEGDGELLGDVGA